jgi:diguanylate cyclase (GGDEF)-like protein
VDPTTVIIVLALHLVSSGGLLYVIGMRTRQRQGLRAFGVAGLLFGLAYAGRLGVGIGQSFPWADGLLDTLMIMAMVTLHSGVRQFNGAKATRWPAYAGVAAVFMLVHVVVVQLGGLTGRHVLLNLGLGLAYAVVAGTAALGAWRSRGEAGSGSGSPLWALTAVTGTLAVSTLARMVQAATLPVASLFAGPLAQVYYGVAVLCAMLLCPALLWMAFVRLNDQLARLAAHDPLTGVLNRKGLADALDRHYATRGHAPVTVLMLDIDHFKRINDTHGHAAGDEVLREVSRRVQAQLRASDWVARVGGEEFLVACPGLDAAMATQLAERVRAAVHAQPVALSQSPKATRLSVTASLGLSSGAATARAFTLAWHRADTALYQAKAAGRDRVVVGAAAC